MNEPTKVTRTFRIRVRLSRASNRVFSPGLDPGVIAEKLISYTLEEAEFDSPLFVASLVNAKDAFVQELITATVNEVKEGMPTQWEELDSKIVAKMKDFDREVTGVSVRKPRPCPNCSTYHNRDKNASLNILAVGHTASIYGQGRRPQKGSLS